MKRTLTDKEREGLFIKALLDRSGVRNLMGKNNVAMEDCNRVLSLCRNISYDYVKANCFLRMSRIYSSLSDYEKMRIFAIKAQEIFKFLNDRKGIASTTNIIGNYYFFTGEYIKALEHFKGFLKAEKGREKNYAIAACVNNIGNIYHFLGNHNLAGKYYKRSLHLEEESGNLRGIAQSMINISINFKVLGNYSSALRFSKRALDILSNFGDKEGISSNLTNIGIVYYVRKQYKEARTYFERALLISEEIGNRRNASVNLMNIGSTYYIETDHENALKYFFRSCAIKKVIGDREGESNCLENIANIYDIRGDHDNSIKYLKEAIKLRSFMKEEQEEAYLLNLLGQLYQEKGKMDLAGQCLKKISSLLENNNIEVKFQFFKLNAELMLAGVNGKYDPLKLAHKILEISNKLDDKGSKDDASLLFARIFSNFGKKNSDLKVRDSFEKAISSYKARGNIFETARAHCFYYQHLKSRGDLEIAKQQRDKALTLFRKLKNQYYLDKLK